jgi:Carboxypeptidase regulatory-like domain
MARADSFAANGWRVLALAALASCGPILNGEAVYAISGTVSGAVSGGVTVRWSGLGSNGNRVTTTDASGRYSFHGLEPADYTVTPSLSGYAFTPVSSLVTVDTLVKGVEVDFTSAPSGPN